MNKLSFRLCLAVLSFSSLSLFAAQKNSIPEWQNPDVNDVNRLPIAASLETDAPVLSLDGMWKFQWFECLTDRSADFYRTDVDDSKWAEIPVPGMWELNGYGDAQYVNTRYAWALQSPNTPPTVPVLHNHAGQYRTRFEMPAGWKGSDVILTIGSATSCVRLWVNGKEVGYSEDSKLQADFDITKFVKPGENLIALEILRWCDGTYMECQDFWRLSGIARGVSVTALPKARLTDLHVNADMNGNYRFESWLTKAAKGVSYEISGPGIDGWRSVQGEGRLSGAKLWSAEEPNLYTLKAEVRDSKGNVTETVKTRFGFRTSKIEDGVLKINGQPVLIKGVNRHELSETGGYVVSREEMIRDLKIMKSLNINAIRTCHYPDDPYLYELADLYGFYVWDEANNESHGMGYKENALSSNPKYNKTIVERVQRMVHRDFNHPSIVVWSLGNESGWGKNFADAADWVHAYDKTRPVHYERAVEDPHVDIYSTMYASLEKHELLYKNKGATVYDYLRKPQTRPYIQCEYAHAMGNSCGGFKEYWDMTRSERQYQGGFIWDFQDQAIKWPSEKSTTGYIYAFGGDINKFEATDNSFNCNGVICADRSLHPHAYEIAYQHQDIWTRATAEGLKDGRVSVYNENFFTDLSKYRLVWTLEADGVAYRSGAVENLNVVPQGTAYVKLAYSEGDICPKASLVTLNVKYILKSACGLRQAGDEVAYEQFVLRESPIELKAGTRGRSCAADFDPKTGALTSYRIGGREMLREPLMPCFGRAVTENDLGAKLEKHLKCWLYPDFKLESFSRDEKRAEARYSIAGLCRVAVTYEFLPDGSIAVRESMSDIVPGAPHLFRFGVEFALDGALDRIKFVGPGPYETYSDRKSSAKLGWYDQKVADQYHYGYVRPQESGTHVDLRLFEILGQDGSGIAITSPSLFSASALPFGRRDIDMSISGGGRAENGDQRHSLELRPTGLTHVNLDLVQMGVGAPDSWGATPFNAYVVRPEARSFEFRIVPVVK